MNDGTGRFSYTLPAFDMAVGDGNAETNLQDTNGQVISGTTKNNPFTVSLQEGSFQPNVTGAA
jgi:hypothetical protein